MPTKKRTQKQKQKQKQTVIVNINEKPKPRRKRTTKKAPTKRTGESSHIPLDAVRDILFQLSKGTHTPDAIMTRVMATRTQDPQGEIIRDIRDADKLPNRPPTSLPPADAEEGILKGNTPQPSPFVSSTTGSNIDDVRRNRNNYYKRPPSKFDPDAGILGGNTPAPSPFVDSTTGTSGTDPIVAVDYDGDGGYDSADGGYDSNAEVAKDAQYLGDYQDTLAKTGLPSRYITSGEPSPSITKVEGRFASSDVPEAFATPAVLQANSIKMNLKTNEELALAGFSGAKELRTAINTWNIGQPATLQINTTSKPGVYKKNDELIAEIKSKHATLSQIKAYHDDHTLVSPHKVKDRQGKK